MITSKQKPSASFTAIDVEYADHEQNICQIGLAVVRDLEITERRSWLVHPPFNRYEQRQTDIHGNDDLEALLYGDGRKFFG